MLLYSFCESTYVHDPLSEDMVWRAWVCRVTKVGRGRTHRCWGFLTTLYRQQARVERDFVNSSTIVIARCRPSSQLAASSRRTSRGFLEIAMPLVMVRRLAGAPVTRRMTLNASGGVGHTCPLRDD